MPTLIDLRSDTVTRPSPEMREAMARAEVGDDVLDHDPTMAELERRVAGIVGKPAALWLPSGCMSNLVALMLHLERGDRFLAPRDAHVISHEIGTAAWLALGMPRELEWALGPGVPDPAAVAEQLGGTETYFDLHTALLVLENTHNHAGGTVLPPAVYAELVDLAHARGLAVHLDGARIWHAAAAQSITVAQAVGAADTVTVCLSKGLGAPMGSVLAGGEDAMAQARRLRKMLGGGVRQGGVVAAAGLVALELELPRIDQDRLRAAALAAGLRELGLEAPEPQSNMVLVAAGGAAEAGELAARWTQAGVACFAMGPGVRLVTHRDIGDADIAEALERIARA
ncbi:MAG: aminotransferase class I/II-fold pyridoxal phosphate-dependent enzyme [Bifidobacteriaceae bacterium]|nr:aminotransferase class I/II-fold pyridoxal phosphate-dependent enzyme [Bifidobacteriaceae bacterium]